MAESEIAVIDVNSITATKCEITIRGGSRDAVDSAAARQLAFQAAIQCVPSPGLDNVSGAFAVDSAGNAETVLQGAPIAEYRQTFSFLGGP